MRKDPSRRDFLLRAATAGAAGVVGGCATSGGRHRLHAGSYASAAKHAKPRARRAIGANDRIQCAFIGVGVRGRNILRAALQRAGVDVVAIADIYDENREAAVAACRGKIADARGYTRFEELLEKETLDAVVIATPDHIHPPAILAALDMGHDVYSEKPMTLTMEQAKVIRDRVNELGAVFQTGTQLRSNTMYRSARAAFQSGAIGKLIAVHVNRNAGGGGARPIPPAVSEKTVRWDLFERDVTHYAFSADRYVNWRNYVEYSNGAAGDLMVHHLDLCHFITGCGMPRRVVAAGGIFAIADGRSCPDTINVLLEYPEKFVFNYLTTYVNGHYGLTERYLGTEGTIEIRDMREMSVFRGRAKEDENEEVVKSEGVLDSPHLEDFLGAMRSRAKTIAPVEAGFMGAACAHMAVLSMRSGEAAHWDSVAEKIRL